MVANALVVILGVLSLAGLGFGAASLAQNPLGGMPCGACHSDGQVVPGALCPGHDGTGNGGLCNGSGNGCNTGSNCNGTCPGDENGVCNGSCIGTDNDRDGDHPCH